MAISLDPLTVDPNTVALSRPAIETGATPDDPSIPSAAYRRMEPRWIKCRACMLGTEAIRAGGTDFVPQYADEDDDRYEVRKNLAAFYNGFARTVLASVGMLLEEEPALGADMPQELVDLSENIDAAGTHLTVFARRLAAAGIIDSYAGVLVEHSRAGGPGVDMSKASEAATVAVTTGTAIDASDEKSLELRPYFLLFKADDIFKKFYETVNGVRTLVLLILREVVMVRVGQFGTKTQTQYRVYTNERGVIKYQLWVSPNLGGESPGRPTLTEGPTVITNQTEIPWSPFVAGEEIAQDEYKPPLSDLADLNIQYHNSLTNNLSLQALAMVPTPVRIGATPDAEGNYPPVVFGPGNTIEAPVTEGAHQPVYWLSPDVSVLVPGENTLVTTKADMGAVGSAFLSPESRVRETAAAKRIDSAAQRATLATVARSLKDCLERAYDLMAKYRNLKGGSVTLNNDFTGEGVDPAYLAVLVTAYQDNVLTLEELRTVIQTGQLPEDFDPEDTTKLIALEIAKQDQARIDAKAAADRLTRNPPPTQLPAAA